MADDNQPERTWLPVIGRALAYLCMRSAAQDEKFDGVLDKVDFLENLGVPTAEAAKAAGSSKASVDELRRLARNKKGRKNGNAKKKIKRRR